MTDTFSKAERSAIMRKVKDKGNRSTEQRLIALFREHNITGWRRNYAVIGKPDFVFLDLKIALFADGCFWHGHNCRNITPKQNKGYWKNKRERNTQRDIKVNELFTARGWKVLRFWECAIKEETIDLSSLSHGVMKKRTPKTFR
jgi:DNA mismatch endonuclease (patch repair protein)